MGGDLRSFKASDTSTEPQGAEVKPAYERTRELEPVYVSELPRTFRMLAGPTR